MINPKSIFSMLCIGSTLFALISCNKNEEETLALEEVTLASITTDSLRAVGSTSLQIGGIITSDGNGMVTRGVCWSSDHEPTISDDTTIAGKGKGSFVSYIENLKSNTRYYFRAYATNSAGTSYGNVLEVTTTETVTDKDGNVYNTIKIGNQLWMAENLKTTHYRNGDPINIFQYGISLQEMKEGSFTNSKHLGMGWDFYGAYYNWFAINDRRSICPEGWHIPTDAEWNTILNTVGEKNFTKQILQHNYKYNDIMKGATNSSGFSAVPAGYCIDISLDGTITLANVTGNVSLWSSTEVNETMGSSLFLKIMFPDKPYLIETSKFNANPVRCIKD